MQIITLINQKSRGGKTYENIEFLSKDILKKRVFEIYLVYRYIISYLKTFCLFNGGF